MESAGAEIDAAETAELIRRVDISYLSEMMNHPGVIARDAEVMGKIAAAKAVGKPVDGHAPGLTGENLEKYVSAGISTDHECATLEEARQRVAFGMKVIVREGSAARNFDALAPIISEAPDMAMLCSDDRHPDDLVQGHIDAMVRRGTALGISVWDMLKAAAVNPVLHYRTGSGLMAPGDRATFIAVDNLTDFNVRQTIMDGLVVYDAADGGLDRQALMLGEPPVEMPNRFEARHISEPDIALHHTETGPTTSGCAKAKVIVVYNRYGHNTPQTGYIKGFGLAKGAIGSSVAHDSHNIVAVGSSDAELVKVINAIIDAKGGIAVSDGQDTDILPLPIAGLMSDMEADELSARYTKLDRKAKSLGCRFHAPFITLSFMALPVTPHSSSRTWGSWMWTISASRKCYKGCTMTSIHPRHSTLCSTSGGIERAQRLAVLVIDTGKTFHHGCVVTLPGAAVSLESSFKVVSQVVNFHMDGCDVTGFGNFAHVLEVVLPLIVSQ